MSPRFLAGLLVFACGFLIGYWWRGATLLDTSIEGGQPGARRDESRARFADPAALRVRPGEGDGRASRGRTGRRRAQQSEAHELDGPDRRDLAAALSALREALQSGDRRAAHEALGDLRRGGGDPLPPAQLRELGSLLTLADPELIHDLARTLVISGGREGLALVMDFVEDENQALEVRRNALHGLAHLPEELASDVAPSLVGFLEEGAPRELERAAAHAVGRLHGEHGAEALLGLLQEQRGIRPEIVFDTIGELGSPEDADSLLGLLAGDWSQHEKLSILRAAGHLAARGDNASALLDLLKETPEGASRSMVAHAIADSSHLLGLSFLEEALSEVAGDGHAQEWIARALTRTHGRKGLEILLQAAEDPAMRLDRGMLAHALHDFQGEEAVPVMMDLLRTSSDERMLEPLAMGLVRNANRETLGELLTILESGEQNWQRRAIARSLAEAGGAGIPPDRLFSMLRDESDPDVAKSLARALHRLHPEALAERAGELFESAASPVERIAFAEVLAKQSTPASIERIARQLRVEQDPKAQWEMARILGRQGERGVERVAEILGEANERQRHEILWGLEAASRPGPPRTRELILDLARKDPSPEIRGQAAEILGRQADRSLIGDLERLLRDESHAMVRDRIQEALRDLGVRK